MNRKMPALFARICAERSQVSVICPEGGALAEPVLYFVRNDAEPHLKELLLGFLVSKECRTVLQEACFPVPGDPLPTDLRIDPFCRKTLLYPERWEQGLWADVL